MKNKWSSLEFADFDKKYRDADEDIWECRHGVWGFREYYRSNRWHAYSGPVDTTYDFGPFTEIDE